MASFCRTDRPCWFSPPGLYLAIVAGGTIIVLLFGKKVETIKGFESMVSLVDAAQAWAPMPWSVPTGLCSWGLVCSSSVLDWHG